MRLSMDSSHEKLPPVSPTHEPRSFILSPNMSAMHVDLDFGIDENEVKNHSFVKRVMSNWYVG